VFLFNIVFKKTNLNEKLILAAKQHKLPLEQVINILVKDFPFFKYLNENQKIAFAKRVIIIIYKKQFFGRSGMEIDLRVKVLLSATVAQLTFGFYTNYWLPKYENIGVYPEQFFSRFVGSFVKGLTSAKGMLLISWEDFLQGLSTNTDKLNVGIHEFAHALYFSYFKEDYDQHFSRFDEIAFKEFLKMRNGNGQNYLRAYAATNPHEFWAVCLEYFFEDPFGFRKHLPQLYHSLCLVMKFDFAKLIEQNRPDLASDYLIRLSETH